MTLDEAIERYHRDMSNSLYDEERKQATAWLAERIGDADKAASLYRDWMAQHWADMRAFRS